MTPRKPPRRSITSIRGEFRHDIITDEDYRLAVEAQSNTLRAAGIERKILGRLRTRLTNGAVDRGERWYFDGELGIVRRREHTTHRRQESG